MKRLHFLFIFVFLLLQLSLYSQWVNIPIYGSYVHSDAVNDQIFWAGRFDVSGASVTTDGGNTWTSSTFTDPKGYSAYCIDAINANTAFVISSTIYKTTNRGTTWTAAPGVYNNTLSFANNIYFFDQNNGVATGDPVDGYFEIYTTTNGGNNWVRVPSSNIPAPLPDEVGIVSTFDAYNNIFWFATYGAADGQRIIRSTDKGYTWTLLATFQIPSLGSPNIEFRDSLHGIFVGNGYLISRTNDGGMTWNTDSLPSWVEFAGPPTYIPGTLSTYVVTSIGLIGKEEQYISLISIDDGITWNRMDTWQSASVSWPPAQRWTSPNSGWLCLQDKGIYKWPGYTGKHIWRAGSSLKYGCQALGEIGDTLGISVGNYGTLPTTINALTLSSTEFSLINPPALPLTLQPWDAVDISISSNPQTRGLFEDSLVIFSDASNYSSISVPLTGMALKFTPLLSNLIYAASDSLYTLSLSNLKATSVGCFDGPQIEGLIIRPADSVLIGISTTTESSTLYKIDPIVGGCIPFVTIPVGNIRSIAYSNNSNLFAGSNTGELYNINTNTGQATPIGTTSGKKYSAFAINPQDGKLYASVLLTFGSPKDAIYLIDTLTGTATLLGLTGDGKPTISIAFNDDGTLYGLKGRLAETNKLITISKTDGRGTEIGTLGKKDLQAIIMRNVITDIKENTEGTKLTSYELFQNYPNPWNPNTTIGYTLKENIQVKLTLLNVLGEEISVLVNEEQDKGYHKVDFNGSKLSSGVYFYQINAGEFIQTKKTILLK